MPLASEDLASTETSVVIPVRNGARFVAQAAVSVLDQLSPGDELLAVDDGSIDSTIAALRGIDDPRLRVLCAGGRGVSAARNVGLAEARGAFVAFLDHDDLWVAGRHRALLRAMLDDEDLTAAFGRVRVLIEADAAPAAVAACAAIDGSHVRELVGSALYRRNAVLAVGGFAEDMHMREDADFSFRLMEHGARVIDCDVDALAYRRHGDNVTNDQTAINQALIELARRRLSRARGKRPPA
ncbi:glycosyltransferase family A protein [Phenylobacterium sp.]|uniref:glycosyltransferase family 2 protein n=1 Tax=Phenylobacterium sp. TaxID=1871053 RepID=UPI002736656E|nr:glycosyltransferase family A protein [Phenylobacterium sp.]MDP3660640.1 glycosyltransferase family A protein [Phenylobacterium sp.]